MACGCRAPPPDAAGEMAPVPRPPGDGDAHPRSIQTPIRLRAGLSRVFSTPSHSYYVYWDDFTLHQRRTCPRGSTRGVGRRAPPNHLDSLRRAHLLPQRRPSQATPGCRPWRVPALERADPLRCTDRCQGRRDAGRSVRDRHGAIGAGQTRRGRCARTRPGRGAGTPAARHRAPSAGAAGRPELRRWARLADARVRRQPLLAAHL